MHDAGFERLEVGQTSHRRSSGLLAEAAEEGANVLDQQLRLLERREMSSARHVGPVAASHQLRDAALPTAGAPDREAGPRRIGRIRWAALVQRVFEVDAQSLRQDAA